MFERFTPHARRVVAVAQEEARLLRSAQIGTEHLLVALARLADEDVAGATLHRHGLTGEKARSEVARLVGVGEAPDAGELPFSPAAHEALQAAPREALELGHAEVQPAHVLLGVLRQRDAVARRVLATAGAHPPQLRAEIVERLAHGRRDVHPDGPSADGRALLEILERNGAVAAWLRERGVDEHAVRSMLGSS